MATKYSINLFQVSLTKNISYAEARIKSYTIAEAQLELSQCPPHCHQQYHRLSLWQPQVPPAMIKLAPWQTHDSRDKHLQIVPREIGYQ